MSDAHSQPLHEAEKEITKAMLGMVVYAVIVRKTPKWDSDAEKRISLIPEHIQYFIDLEKQDKVLLAGPFIDDPDRPDGLIIMKGYDSVAEVDAVIAQDVFHLKGYRTYEINTWLLNEGAFTVRIALSDQGFRLA
jgi:uncharacterized protein